ncbi:MAG: DUF2071 domain-containing protein [Gemmatimonadetes bacterium]|nr:DUF2071 domain-containing protein [Gemmatimonadota bacterium]
MPPRHFLTADWRYLAMINYQVDPSQLRPRVPRGTELDLWNDRTFVSLVGFLFLKTRVLGIPVPFHRDFEEVNLRFYVRRRAAEGWRRGVVFIKEIVPRTAVALVARAVYGEKYVALPMRHRIDVPSGQAEKRGSVQYEWKFNGEWNGLRVEPVEVARATAPASEEEFITEHYWGYSTTASGTIEYGVEHPRWRVWRVATSAVEGDLAGLYGAECARWLEQTPSSAFLADGSPVVVRRGASWSSW